MKLRTTTVAVTMLLVTGVAAAADRPGVPAIPYAVVGDSVPQPLTNAPGDPVRGRAIVADRQVGLCLLCHSGPFPEEHFQGNLAPDLAGTGARWSDAQLRLRVVDARRVNSSTIMPPYYVAAEGRRVGAAWSGKPILDAQQVEDVIAFLVTLR